MLSVFSVAGREDNEMEIIVSKDKQECGEAAGKKAAELLKRSIAEKGLAVFIAATGASQFDFLATLTKEKDVDWGKTTMFHLDEYLGISESHPASFRKYLKERLISKVEPGSVNLVNGEADDPVKECDRLGQLICGMKIDAAFIGIGENGHLAFNDPPADFDTEEPYLVVELDEACRRQQMGEGWFKTLEDVPKKAISMSVRQIMEAKTIICTVPDERKAQAVKGAVEGEISPDCPASILQEHPDCHIFLDTGSAKLLSKR